MELKDIMNQIFSTLFVFRDNTHNLHVSCKGTGSMYYHPFLGDVYNFADSKLDRLMEHAQYEGVEIAKTYESIQIQSKILVYENIETRVDIQKNLVKTAMDKLMDNLRIRETACKETDTVLNTQIIDWRRELQVFIFKNNSELGL